MGSTHRFRPFTAFILLAAILSIPMPVGASARGDLLPYYSNDGLSGLVRRLKRVESGVRVLHIAAHPDDEDSALLAWLSLGQGARVTYLSLTRGEGGQNLIGPERGAELGVLRTSELLAARRLDGASQLFGRMIDFGFSKSPEECFEKWGRENVVEDVVRAIRFTRPHIIICRFQGTPQDGHGQHQASAIAAREAFEKAADPKYAPDMLKEGMAPWQAQKFYVGSFDDSARNAIHIDTGDYDPIEGRSYAAIGYKGRSQHRSQDMGMIEYETPMRDSAYILEKSAFGGAVEEDGALFDGVRIEHVDLCKSSSGIYRLPNFASDPLVGSGRIAETLKLWRENAPEDIEAICDLEHALAISLGIRAEAFSKSAQQLTIHGSIEIICNAYVPDPSAIEKFTWTMDLEGMMEAREDLERRASADKLAVRNSLIQSAFLLTTNRKEPSTPFFMMNGQQGHIYAPPAGGNASLPFEPPLAIACFKASYQSIPFGLRMPAEVREADPGFGEIREDLQIIPELSGGFDSDNFICNQRAPDLKNELRVRLKAPKGISGDIWIGDSENSLLFKRAVVLAPGQEQFVSFPFQGLPSPETSTTVPLLMMLSDEAGRRPIYEVQHMDYRHVRPRFLSRPAGMQVHIVNVQLPSGIRVGYVPGAEDEVPQTLVQSGLPLTILDVGDLAATDLAAFDAIVLGARAYEVRPDLEPNNTRLFAYVENGGTLIAQYNKYEYVDRNLAPRMIKMRRPHDRVTDENAKIMLLQPDHPIFNSPNKLTEADFDGWVQERGLYFCSEWDSAYQPLMSCADPGEPQQKGGMLHLKLGAGHFIYTGYSFFRQIPAGHEGAIKLFVNMISIGQKTKEASAK